MMKTRRLFYENVYQKDFEAEVLFCGEDEAGTYVILDQTVFYPEGGGQPADRGVLCPEHDGGVHETCENRPESAAGAAATSGEPESSGSLSMKRSGQISVLDVQYAGESGEDIRHYVDQPLSAGTKVHGFIDWERRFDLMQQHSGEHIVSGCVHKKYGYDNVGFHMGEDVITIDFNGLLDEVQLLQVEKEVNDYIWENRPARIFFPDAEERKRLPFRSKKELTGEVRLVEFPGGDLCACCGLHVEAAGEIGLVKLLSVKHFREGVRVEMVSGKRALRLLHQHLEANSRVAVELSVKPDQTPEAVRHLQDEIYALKGQIASLRQEQFAMRASQCRGKGSVLVLEQNLDAAEVRKEADAVLDTCGGICVVISLEEPRSEKQKDGNNGAGGKYAIGQRDGDVRELVKEMNGALSGKGGGKPFFAQGFLQAEKKDIVDFFTRKGFMIV